MDQSLQQRVLAGLAQPQKTLPAALFYDDIGTALFQRIAALPEYYLSRVEGAILRTQAEDIAALLAPPQAMLDLVELGSGDGTRTELLCAPLLRRCPGLVYRPVDSSALALAHLAAHYARALPRLPVQPLHGDYFAHWPVLQAGVPRAVLFMGSNLGNYRDDEAVALLAAVRARLRPGDRLLLGVDRCKDPRIVRTAYDDAAGVTAQFNLNLLARLNRELGFDFDLERFAHYASYCPLEGTARSFLVSSVAQRVRSAAAGCTLDFAAGETIYTEQSQKYDDARLNRLAAASGFAVERHFMDDARWYSVVAWHAIG
jgi:L-histidine Nalpha-methyltransferase